MQRLPVHTVVNQASYDRSVKAYHPKVRKNENDRDEREISAFFPCISEN